MEKLIDFCFKGDRTYVHGTDMLNTFIREADLATDFQQASLDFTIHKIARHKLILVFPDAVSAEMEPHANLYVSAGDTRLRYTYVESDQEVDCRYEYDEDSIVRAADYNGEGKEITLSEFDKYTTIEKIVALNKGLLQKLFPGVPGKWYFTRIRLSSIDCLNEAATAPIKVAFRKNFNFKLTASRIFIDGNEVGEINFSLV